MSCPRPGASPEPNSCQRARREEHVNGHVHEFKDFINKGNMLGIAVGFVMGAAFTAVVTALVDNVIMPITAIPFGTPNFDSALILTVERHVRSSSGRSSPHW